MNRQQLANDLETIGNMHIALADACRSMPEILSARIFCYEALGDQGGEIRPEIRLSPQVFERWHAVHGGHIEASALVPGALEITLDIQGPRGPVHVSVVCVNLTVIEPFTHLSAEA